MAHVAGQFSSLATGYWMRTQTNQPDFAPGRPLAVVYFPPNIRRPSKLARQGR